MAALSAIYGAFEWRAAPSPRHADAPPQGFSAEGALAVLRRLEGTGLPHPVGSPEAARVRSQIVDELGRLGIQAEVHDGYGCSFRSPMCAPVHNVLARLSGREPGQSVLLMAHYDSVVAGPGAADDEAGVAAIIEIARALKAGPPLRHGVMLLVDEGEEGGLMGAEAFAASDPWVDEVAAVVNLEARGTSGASRLFEMTGYYQPWLVDRVAKALPHPATSSIDTTIYDLLPNDTDLSVFRRRGTPGVNFAFIGDAARYHTPLDDITHLSLASLQHQGENGLAAVRALANADDLRGHSPGEKSFDRGPPARAVFFDVAGWRVFSWPAKASPGLANAGLLLVLATLLRLKPRPGALIVVARIAMVIATVGLSWGVAREIVKAGTWAGAFSSSWIAHPFAVIALMWVIPLAVLVGVLWILNLFVDLPTNWLGLWLLWSALAIGTALFLPGTSHLFIIPLGVAAVTGVIFVPSQRWGFIAAIAPIPVAAVIWFPLLQAWYDALGTPMLPVLAAFVSVFTSLLLPLLAAYDRRSLAVLFGRLALGSLALVIVSACVPPRTREHPTPLLFQLRVDGDTHTATWGVLTPETELPEPMTRVARFHPAPGRPLREPTFTADAGTIQLAPPTVQVLENVLATRDGVSLRLLRLHVASNRGAPCIDLTHDDGSEDVLQVKDALPATRRKAGPARHVLCAVPPEGIDLQLTIAGHEKRLVVSDISFGLPEEGQALLATRPADFTTLREGDLTFVSHAVPL